MRNIRAQVKVYLINVKGNNIAGLVLDKVESSITDKGVSCLEGLFQIIKRFI